MEVKDVASSAVQNIGPKPPAPIQPEQWLKELHKAGENRAPETQQASPSDTLTKAEQSYFAELFPAASPEIQAQALYRNDGSKAATSLGTVVDRKG